MQLHPFELYSLLELVEPGLYGSYSQYEERRRDLPQLNALMGSSNHGRPCSQASARSNSSSIVPCSWSGIPVTSDNLDNQAGREAVVDFLVQRHPMAECLVRNRKAEIGGFTKREAHRVEVRLTAREAELYADVTRYTRDGYRWAQENKNAMVGFLMVSYQKMFQEAALKRSGEASVAVSTNCVEKWREAERAMHRVVQLDEPGQEARQGHEGREPPPPLGAHDDVRRQQQPGARQLARLAPSRQDQRCRRPPSRSCRERARGVEASWATRFIDAVAVACPRQSRTSWVRCDRCRGRFLDDRAACQARRPTIARSRRRLPGWRPGRAPSPSPRRASLRV